MSASTSASAVAGRELYRAVWDLVNTTFFDTSRLVDWKSWEHRFDDVIDSEDTALRYVDEMLASLNDRYTYRLPPAVVPSPTAAQTSSESQTPASRAPASQAPASQAPASRADSDVPAQTDVLSGLTTDNLAYLRITTFDRDDICDLVETAVNKVANCSGIMLDLRLNGGGLMHRVLESCGFLLDEGHLATIEFRHGDGIKTRSYYLSSSNFFVIEELPDGTRTKETFPRRRPVLANKPIVIMFNSRTASGGEMMAVTLVQNGIPGWVHLVGSGTTPGKGIGQAEYALPNGRGGIQITRNRWLCPGGEWLGDCGQTTSGGIDPDTQVPDDRETPVKTAAKILRQMLGRPTEDS